MSALQPPPTHPPPFAVEAEDSGPDVVVVLHGELDMAATPSLAVLMDEVAARESRRVIFDIADLWFVDAVGLGALRSAARDLRAGGTEVVVGDPQRAVRRLLLLCGLDNWAGGESSSPGRVSARLT
ncbi:MAG TPA: STAS domain-containing protein [Miltoncostaeaceae bacterium]|nr:STAS domain-containing protein [Miltoncostaeaceae bacterium]